MSNLSVKRHEGELPAEVLAPLRMMRRLLGWDPFQQMAPFVAAEEPGLTFTPAFEVKETKDAYDFRADVPGVNEEDIDITVTGNRLTISGKREAEVEERTGRYFATERQYGSFVRSFTLPDGVDADRITASLANGVLTVAVPKKPETQPKKIVVAKKSEPTGSQKRAPAQGRSEEPEGVHVSQERAPSQSREPQSARSSQSK